LLSNKEWYNAEGHDGVAIGVPKFSEGQNVKSKREDDDGGKESSCELEIGLSKPPITSLHRRQ